jgi:ribosomal protein S18 acetylase RimI-like enzyme
MSLRFSVGNATADDVRSHLIACNESFRNRLLGIWDLDIYSKKLETDALTFEAWEGQQLVGIVAGYVNNLQQGFSFVSNVSVLPSYYRRGIASGLLAQFIDHSRRLGFRGVMLSVDESNNAALNFYEKLGFFAKGQCGTDVSMQINLDEFP